MNCLIIPREITRVLNRKVTLNEEQREIFDYINFHLQDEIYSKPPFCLASFKELRSTKSNINKLIKHAIKKVSVNTTKKYKLVGSLLTDEYAVIFTDDPQVVETFIKSFIIRNISEFGAFIELWQQPTIQDIIEANNGNDLIVAGSSNDSNDDDDLLDPTDPTHETIQDIAEASFEENRRLVQSKLYDENNNWKLHFITHAVAERTPDNDSCLLCYDRADYICYDCGYPLCSHCVKHLKHSTNKCPNCQFQPVHYQPIEDGDRTIEEHNDGVEMNETN